MDMIEFLLWFACGFSGGFVFTAFVLIALDKEAAFVHGEAS